MAGSAAKPAPYTAGVPEFWAVVDGTEYATHSVRAVSEDWVKALRTAANDAWRVFDRVRRIAPFLDQRLLREMGMPPESFGAFSDTLEELPTVFGRFDFIETPSGFRVIEFNAETPYFWVETHRVNALACAYVGRPDPNHGCEEHIVNTMRRVREACQAATIGVTASNVFREDYWTASYFAELWTKALETNVPVMPIHELQADDDGLYHQSRRIDLLHRCYPLEHFAADRSGARFFELLRARRIRIVNPGAALFLQNKMTQCLIWGLYERGAFEAREREIVERLFLPTHADLPQAGTWIRKPVLGREGNSIAVFTDGIERSHTPSKQYAAQPSVFQKFIDAPRVEYSLSDGEPREGFAIATCAVVGGEAGAVGMRVGGRITDGWAHFQPLSL